MRIPEGVREVIGRRLDRLTDACNEVLAVASVIGREFGLDLLKGSSRITPRTGSWSCSRKRSRRG